MKQQKKEGQTGTKKMPQSAQDKGLMLARLLEKAVQNKKNSMNSVNTSTIISNETHTESSKANLVLTSLEQQRRQEKQSLSQTLSQSINQTAHTITVNENQTANKFSPKHTDLKSNDAKTQIIINSRDMFKSNNSKDVPKQTSFLKQVLSKQTYPHAKTSQMRERLSMNQSEISFDDSLLIQPSFATHYAQQLGEMLKYIYVEIFNLQKYQIDLKKYQEIETNPQLYKIDPTQDFNKEGKLLENIIQEIKTLKNTLNKQKIHSHQLNTQLDEAYAKTELQEQQISSLQEEIIKLEKKLVFQQNKTQTNQSRSNRMEEKSILTHEEYKKIFQENEVIQGAMTLLQEENINLQQTILNLKTIVQKLQLQLEEVNHKLQIAVSQAPKEQGFEQILQEKRDIQVKLEQKIISLEKNIQQRDNEIENLLSIVAQLQNQLNQIKQDIQKKETTETQHKILMQKQIQQLSDKCSLLLQENQSLKQKNQLITESTKNPIGLIDEKKLIDHLAQQTNKQNIKNSPCVIEKITNDDSSFDIRKLSTIKEDQNEQQLKNSDKPHSNNQQSQVEISEFTIDNDIQSSHVPVIQNKYMFDKQAQTQTLHQQVDFRNNLYVSKANSHIDNSQLQRLVLELKKVLTHKEKTIMKYEKQIQSHESQVDKYQSFIAQLSAEIQQLKITMKNHKNQSIHRQELMSKNIQTEQNYFTFMKINHPTSSKNTQYQHNQLKQASIAEEIDLKERQAQLLRQPQSNKQINKINLISIDKYRDERQEINNQEIFNQQSNIDQISGIMSREKFLDEVSVTLSQFSQTQELNDIRNLTQQLSQAYDKIIALTYQLTHLKQTNSKLINHKPINS